MGCDEPLDDGEPVDLDALARFYDLTIGALRKFHDSVRAGQPIEGAAETLRFDCADAAATYRGTSTTVDPADLTCEDP